MDWHIVSQKRLYASASKKALSAFEKREFLGRKQSNKTYIIEKKAEKKAPTHKGRH